MMLIADLVICTHIQHMGQVTINQPINQSTLASSYITPEPSPSIHPVARGTTPLSVALPPSFCLVAVLHETGELTLLKAGDR
jgi:hypothetical protein